MSIRDLFGGRKDKNVITEQYIQEGLNLGLAGKIQDSIDCFSKAIKLNPNCTKALLLGSVRISLSEASYTNIYK